MTNYSIDDANGNQLTTGLQAHEAQLDALRSRAINDVTRAIMADGITLTFGDVDDLGDETMAWIGSRLGLSVTTTDRGVECRVTR